MCARTQDLRTSNCFLDKAVATKPKAAVFFRTMPAIEELAAYFRYIQQQTKDENGHDWLHADERRAYTIQV